MAKYCKKDKKIMEYDYNTDEYYCPDCGEINENDEENYQYDKSTIFKNDLEDFNYMYDDYSKIIGKEKYSYNYSVNIESMIIRRNELLNVIYDYKLNAYKQSIMSLFNKYYTVFSKFSHTSSVIIVKILIFYSLLYKMDTDIYKILNEYISKNMSQMTARKYKKIINAIKIYKNM